MTDDLTMIPWHLPNIGDLELYPLADVHVGSRSARLDRLDAFLAFILEADNRFLVLIGDLIDNGTKTSLTGPYEQTMNPSEQRELITEK